MSYICEFCFNYVKFTSSWTDVVSNQFIFCSMYWIIRIEKKTTKLKYWNKGYKINLNFTYSICLCSRWLNFPSQYTWNSISLSRNKWRHSIITWEIKLRDCSNSSRWLSKYHITIPFSIYDSFNVKFYNNCDCPIKHNWVIERVSAVSVVIHSAFDRSAQRLSCSYNSIAVQIRVDSSLVVNLDNELVSSVSNIVACRIFCGDSDRVSCECNNAAWNTGARYNWHRGACCSYQVSWNLDFKFDFY